MRTPRPISEEQKESLKKLLHSTKTKADYKRILCVWLRANFNMSSSQVAKAVGMSASTVKIIQASYFKDGEKALIGEGRGGRRRENLTVSDEKKLLDEFLDKSREGGVIVVTEIKQAYEDAVGRSVPKSTVYRMLRRHGWRKLAPRPKHPKSDPEKREAFKKTP